VSGKGEGVGQSLDPPTPCGSREGAMPLPGKCKLHAQKVEFGAYFCVLLLLLHEIIVASKLLGDLVQALGAGRLTFWETPGNSGRLGTPGNRWVSSQSNPLIGRV